MWGIVGPKVNILDFSIIFSLDLSEILLNPYALLEIAVGHRTLSDCKRFFCKKKFESSHDVGQFFEKMPSKFVSAIQQSEVKSTKF